MLLENGTNEKKENTEIVYVYPKELNLKAKIFNGKSKTLCLENCGRKRAKGKTRCSTCLREFDVTYWAKRAWTKFAKSLKNAQVSFQGYFTCWTCDETKPIQVAQAGHCFHRGRQNYKALDFDPNHIRLQCSACNMDMNGNKQNIFQAKLVREIGIERVEEMIWRRVNEPALTIPELQEIIKKYSV